MALGKGMKDLISKNFGIEEKGTAVNADKAKEELKINISRYQAQGLDVSSLKKLEGKDARTIMEGIADYRRSVKKLAAANTVIKSLEPYGYSNEIEEINKDIKDPSKAYNVLTKVEELRKRALSEHNVDAPRKETPKVKLPHELERKAERIKGEYITKEDEDLDASALDELMSNLDELGSAFDLPAEDMVEDKELLEKIKAWEDQGLFVDELKNLLTEDIELARKESQEFEKDLEELMVQKERFENMDLSKFKKQAEELKIKFQYPNMASEIRNELDMMEKYLKELRAEDQPASEEDRVDAADKDEDEGGLSDIPVSRPEDHMGTDATESPDKKEGTAPPLEKEAEPQEEPEEAEPLEDQRFPDLDIDQLLDRAKEAYRNGDNEGSLEYFREILRKDPDNSKARFMIRRLSSRSR